MEFLGNEIGGRYFPTDRIMEDMVMFSFGVGEDISFELEMTRRGVKCILFDPTPRAIKYMKQYPNMEFYPWGLYHKPGRRRFYYPKDPEHVSCSIGNLQKTDKFFTARCISLDVAEQKFGEYNILKMDIEGAEYMVLEKMQFAPEILMVEFHGPREEKYVDMLKIIYQHVHKDGHDYLAL